MAGRKMYEIRSNLTSNVIHLTEQSFRNQWNADFPNWIQFIKEKTETEVNLYGINRRDLEWHEQSNSMQTIILFNTLEGALNYMRMIYNDIYNLNVDKTSYNDVQFEQYILNTDVTIYIVQIVHHYMMSCQHLNYNSIPKIEIENSSGETFGKGRPVDMRADVQFSAAKSTLCRAGVKTI